MICYLKKSLLLLSFIILSLAAIDMAAYAQGRDTNTRVDETMKREMTIVEDASDDEFMPPSIENLARLYWHLGVFDFGDDNAVDNYLRISECNIYTKFSKDEFEWVDIRNATRTMLTKNKARFDNKFKFVMPVSLGDYDQDRGGFNIIDNTDFPSLKRIEFMSPDNGKDICYENKKAMDYERNILLILDKPLDFTFAFIHDHVAQAYILRKRYESQQVDERVRVRRYAREAYIRLRMNIHEYQGSIKGRATDGDLAILYGSLDGIDLFEDFEQTTLLSSYTLEEIAALNAQFRDGE